VTSARSDRGRRRQTLAGRDPPTRQPSPRRRCRQGPQNGRLGVRPHRRRRLQPPCLRRSAPRRKGGHHRRLLAPSRHTEGPLFLDRVAVRRTGVTALSPDRAHQHADTVPPTYLARKREHLAYIERRSRRCHVASKLTSTTTSGCRAYAGSPTSSVGPCAWVVPRSAIRKRPQRTAARSPGGGRRRG
jgi:hypothetical protein